MNFQLIGKKERNTYHSVNLFWANKNYCSFMERETIAAWLGIIAVSTLVGNTMVVIFFVKKREWLNKAHTCLLLALAIQDILTAICLLAMPRFALPPDVYELPTNPTYRQLYCSVIWSHYIPFALSVVTMYTCLMMAIDRWLAVLRPMSYRRYSSSTKLIATMVTLPWIAGILLDIGTPLSASSLPVGNGSYVCILKGHVGWPENRAARVLLTLLKGIFPATLMAIAYTQMVIQLRKTTSRRRTTDATDSILSNSHHNETSYSVERITRMVIFASACVIICWLPDQMYFCLHELNIVTLDESTHSSLHILAFLNTSLNPFLYVFSNSQYKDEFKKIFCWFYKEGEDSSANAIETHAMVMDQHAP